MGAKIQHFEGKVKKIMRQFANLAISSLANYQIKFVPLRG